MKVKLCDGVFTFDHSFLPQNSFERDHLKLICVKLEEIEEPIKYYRTYHPVLATVMDSIHDDDNSKMQCESKLTCIVTYDVEDSRELPSWCWDSCGRMIKPISVLKNN